MRKEIIGDAQLYLGDCMEILPTLPKVDAVITDPPYGIGFASQPTMYQRKNGHEPKDWDRAVPPYQVFQKLRAMSRVMAVWGGNYFDLPKTRCWLSWLKPDSAPSMADFELCWTSLDANARAFHKSVKSSALEKDMVNGFHPTQKPLALMEWTLEKIGAQGAVCDPYMGSGTTGVAAVRARLPFVGIEVNEAYFDIACRRIEQAYKQRPLFDAEPQRQPEQLGIEA
jgi:site-specific DNA-methyltransferase (adenine-specific)/modification methylase